MDAGELRHRVTFQERDSGRDAAGQAKNTYHTFLGPVYARVQPLEGRELVSAQAINGETTHRVTVRFRSDKPVTLEMRVAYGSRYLYITAPPRDLNEAHEWWEIDCKEGLEN